jgi:hypothetical protein
MTKILVGTGRGGKTAKQLLQDLAEDKGLALTAEQKKSPTLGDLNRQQIGKPDRFVFEPGIRSKWTG